MRTSHIKTLTVSLTVVALLSLTWMAQADYPGTVQSLNPPGYWRLNEPGPIPPNLANNLGSLGEVGNGIYAGSMTRPVAGALAGSADTATSFTGGSVVVPYDAGLNPAIFTIEAWLKPELVFNGLTCPLASMRVPGPRAGWNFYQSDAGWNFRTYNSEGTATAANITADDFLIADQWYHVVATWDGNVARLYVNGVLGATSAPTTFSPNLEANFTVGARSDGAFVWRGAVDEVAYYPSVLSAVQVQEHYNNGINPSPTTPYQDLVLAKSPLGYWRLNEPAYSPLVAVNTGTLGSAMDGVYSTSGATAGVPGPQQGQFAGFDADNRAVQFNGTSGDVTAPALNWNTDTITFAAWVNLDRHGPADLSGVVFSRGASATGIDIRNSGELRYHWLDGMWGYSSGLIVPTNQWVFVALTVEPTQAVLYMGTEAGLVSRTNAVAHGFGVLNDPLYLGRDQPARRLAGRLDEAMVFDRALSYDTISDLFSSAMPAIFNVIRTPANPVFEGVDVTFTANAASSAPITYQWRKDGVPIGGNSPILTLANVTPADDGDYDVVVTSGGTSVTSLVDNITVVAGPPIILAQPVPATRYAGADVTFNVTAGGTSPFTYQWLVNGETIPDATERILTLTGITMQDQANYSVRVTNPNGQIVSAPAALTVLPAPSDYAQVALQRGAAGYWALDETSGTTAFDHASGMHGTFPAPPVVTLGVEGPRPPAFDGFSTGNTAYELDGVNGWVTVPALNWNTNTVTFSAWVNLTGYDDDLSGVVFSRGSSASGLDIRSDGELRYHWDGGMWGWSSGLTVPTNEWVFLALVVTPTSGTVYMGTAEALVSRVNNANHGVAALSDPLYLGRDRTDRPLIGQIDEVAVFKRSLSANDIGALYGVGTGIPLVITMTPGGIIEDSKPVGTPHHGYNYGSTWLTTSGPDNRQPPIIRSGVAEFSAAVGSQILVPPHADFDSPTGTICFWMRATTPLPGPGPGNEGAILFDRRTSDGTVIVLDDFGSIFIQCAGGANSFFGGYVSDDDWHFVAVTYDQSASGAIGLYIDGELTTLIDPSTQNPNPNTSAWSWPTAQPIELGRSHDGYWRRYDGQLDDFRIYDRILSGAELTAIYQSDDLVDTGALKLRYNFNTAGGGQTLSWPYGILERSPTLGPDAVWIPVPEATPPWPIMITSEVMFYRISL